MRNIHVFVCADRRWKLHTMEVGEVTVKQEPEDDWTAPGSPRSDQASPLPMVKFEPEWASSDTTIGRTPTPLSVASDLTTSLSATSTPTSFLVAPASTSHLMTSATRNLPVMSAPIGLPVTSAPTNLPMTTAPKIISKLLTTTSAAVHIPDK